MEQHLGRTLKYNEVVDHINGNQKDNSIKNLRVMSRAEHTRMHMKQLFKNKKFKQQRIKAIRKATIKYRLPHTEDKFTCCHCKRLKHKTEFWPRKDRWNGLRPLCIECETKIKNKRLGA